MKPVDFRIPPVGALRRSTAHFARPAGADLLERTARYEEWRTARVASGTWPYSRALESAAGPHACIVHEDGQRGEGINFASQDYLAMNSHPLVLRAAKEAMDRYGVHSAGSPALLGNTTLSLGLERALSEYLDTEHIVLFPTGWAAAYGAIAGLVRQDDHVVYDELSHASLQSGLLASTRRATATPHLDVQAMIDAVRGIRAADARNGILVVTESLFSMDSDTPRLRTLQDACRELNATLLVDVAHDLGNIGPNGHGHLGLQGLLGQVDLVMGSFSKTFASNGGFLATGSPNVRQFVKAFGGTHTFSNALSPAQAAIVLAVLDIVRSDEGAQRRADLLLAVHALRRRFARHQISCLGEASAIVPVPVGSEAVARVASYLMFRRGVLANLVEFPAVRSGTARFRMQVMASHSPDDAVQAADVVAGCISEAAEIVGHENEQELP